MGLLFPCVVGIGGKTNMNIFNLGLRMSSHCSFVAEVGSHTGEPVLFS